MKPLNEQYEPGKSLLAWWSGLDDNRAARATLRRAGNVTQVTLTPHYQALYKRLCAHGWNDEGRPYLRDALAATVGLLAHVEHNDDEKLPVRMSKPAADGGRAPVSPLRFMRLLESPDLEALFTGLRRVLPLMGHRADVLALSNAVIRWDDDVKKRWAYDYLWPDDKAPS
jgi:CRISPR system Cascade subunit CasB